MSARCLAPFILLCASILSAQSSAPALQGGPRMDRETLAGLYKAELQDKFTPDLVEPLHKAHESIEAYFAATTLAERRRIAAAIATTGIDPNLLGRITRIRMDWPACAGGGVFYINQRVGPHTVLYFLGIPARYDRTRPGGWPLLVKLPTAHAFIGDRKPDAAEVARIHTAWINEELQKHPDVLVLMPLLNLDELYGPSLPGMNSVIQPLLHVSSLVNVDPRRVYMLGHDMSAHATWNLALHYPTYFAAICPLAGSADDDFQRLRLPMLRNILTVTWHDVDDKVVRVNSTRALVRTLKNLKCDVEYEETKKLGHLPPGQIVDKLYDAMIARTRELYPKQVTIQSNRQELIYNRLDWVEVFQPLDARGEHRMVFRHGSGYMTVNKASHVFDARVTGPNQITITADNVATARLLFNDRMIDFARPVTIQRGTVTLFEGMLKPSVEQMLNAQLTIGRGWRYFTAAWDYDVNVITPATRPSSGP